jgi:hypothetical protein
MQLSLPQTGQRERERRRERKRKREIKREGDGEEIESDKGGEKE